MTQGLPSRRLRVAVNNYAIRNENVEALLAAVLAAKPELDEDTPGGRGGPIFTRNG